MATYTATYAPEFHLANGGSYVDMTFDAETGVFDISTHSNVSSDAAIHSTMTINGRTLDIAVNLEPYEQVIQVPNGNYSGANPAPLHVTETTLTVNQPLTFSNNASLTLDENSDATFNGTVTLNGGLTMGDDLTMEDGVNIVFDGSGNVDLNTGNVNLLSGNVNLTSGDVIVSNGSSTATLKNVIAFLMFTYGIPNDDFFASFASSS
jgi:hypothetical protein